MRTFIQRMALLPVLLATVAASAQEITTIGKEVPLDIRVRLYGQQSQQDDFYLFRHLRGSVGLFYFWRPGNLRAIDRVTEINALAERYRERGVKFVSVTVLGNDRVGETLGTEPFQRFHYNIWNASGIATRLGAFSDPYIVLLDPFGRIVWRGVPDKYLEERLEDLCDLTPPPAGNEALLDERMSQAQRYLGQREFGRSFTTARWVFEVTDASQPIHVRAEALMQQSQAAAAEWLNEAINLEQDGRVEEAARIVAEIAVRFRDPEEDFQQDQQRGDPRDNQEQNVQRRAQIEIGRMSANLDTKKQIRDARENAEAEMLNDEATRLEESEYYVRAREIYERVIEEYKDTAAAKEARNRLRRIRGDRAIREKIAERRAAEEAHRWLDIGDRLAAFNFVDRARDQYQRIIEEHGSSRAAERARQRLRDLPEAEAAARTGDE